jgi:hypothetical protein
MEEKYMKPLAYFFDTDDIEPILGQITSFDLSCSQKLKNIL